MTEGPVVIAKPVEQVLVLELVAVSDWRGRGRGGGEGGGGRGREGEGGGGRGREISHQVLTTLAGGLGLLLPPLAHPPFPA